MAARITLRLEVTGPEDVLDAVGHDQLLDAGETIREALRDIGIRDSDVTVLFTGDNMVNTF